MTALVLGEKGSPEAVMPMSIRTIAATRGRELAVGWLSSNQFASRMGLRRQTRETAPEWPGLLPELDALLVMRRDESSLSGGAGRWYGQTGFEDVLSIRCLYLDMKSPPMARSASAGGAGGGARYQVQVATPSDAAAWNAEATHWQSEMLAVYRDVYGAYGGPRTRGANFWSPALAHHYYREHYQFQIIGLWSAPANGGAAMLMGYAVVGWSGWHSKRPRMDILELATRQWDTAVAGDLIRTTCQLAWSKNVRQVRAVISAHDPYRGHLARSGFVDRWGYVMQGKWLNAQRYLDRLVAGTGEQGLARELGEIAIELATPGAVPLTLRRAGTGTGLGAGITMRLQGNARTITRLLLNRLDITAALQEGTLSPAGGGGAVEKFSESESTRLSLVFPWTPWAFHMLDYI